MWWIKFRFRSSFGRTYYEALSLIQEHIVIKISSLHCNGPSCPPLLNSSGNPGWLFRLSLILLNKLRRQNILLKSQLIDPFSLPIQLVHMSKISPWWIAELSGFCVFITLKLRAEHSNVSGLRACQSRGKKKICSYVSSHSNWSWYAEHFILYLLPYRINQPQWAEFSSLHSYPPSNIRTLSFPSDFSNCSLFQCKW